MTFFNTPANKKSEINDIDKDQKALKIYAMYEGKKRRKDEDEWISKIGYLYIGYPIKVFTDRDLKIRCFPQTNRLGSKRDAPAHILIDGKDGSNAYLQETVT